METNDGTVYMFDEEGNEIEFKILHSCEYKNVMYYMLWGEDDDGENIYIITQKDKDGDHCSVDDDEVRDYVWKSFKISWKDFTEEMKGYMEKDVFLDDLKGIFEDGQGGAVKDSIDSLKGNMEICNLICSFDEIRYREQVNEESYKQAYNLFLEGDYQKAFSLFLQADKGGNTLATTLIGVMYHYGYGCKKDRVVAMTYFQKGAREGCPLAGAWMSEYYRMGYEIEKNIEISQDIFDRIYSDLDKMCNEGDALALYFLGYNLIMGIGVNEDENRGVEYIMRASALGLISAKVMLAECYYKGWGVDVDYSKTIDLLMKNPVGSNVRAQYILGLCNYFGEGLTKNQKKAFWHFRNAANLGHGKSKYYLAICYYYGEGTEQDVDSAVKWFSDAADNHRIGEAAYELADMYRYGKGIEKNEAESVHYYLIAAEEGDIDSQKNIAREYFNGYMFENRFLEHNAKEACAWMERAAIQDDIEAQIMLGSYLASDKEIEDEEKAFEWFMKAACKNDAFAEYLVGGCYKHGVGVLPDIKKARYWLKKAADDGNEQAIRELKEDNA